MKKQVSRIDENGFFIEPVLVHPQAELDEDLIEDKVPEGFYSPKWDSEKWVEGKSQDEIDEIKNAPKPVSRIDQIESRSTMLQTMDRNVMQRMFAAEQKNAELEQRIAELENK